MEAGIDAADLQVFEFELVDGEVSDPDFAFCDHAKEFKYHGHSYDIFRSASVDGKIRFWVIADDTEDALLAQLLEHDRHDHPGRDVAKTFFKFFGKSLPQPSAIAFVAAADAAPRTNAPQQALDNPILDILSPPPQA